MNNSLLEFDYNGCTIPFIQTESDVMINATEMIKLFPGKRINNFLRSEQTQELIRVLESETRISASQLVVVVKGNYSTGVKQGTWMHRLIAISFSMWLDPKFHYWCLSKLDEIINNGFALRDAEIGRLNSIISSYQPQVDYYNQVLTTSDILYTTRDIVTGCGFRVSNKQLMKVLRDNNYIFDQSGRWYLREPWGSEGYIKEVIILGRDGKPKQVRRWTESGKYWLCSIGSKFGLL